MSTAKKEVLYSRRYHFENELAKIQQFPVPPRSAETKAQMDAKFAELMRSEKTYVKKPGIEEKEKTFIELAQRLSTECEIDMDITRYPGYIDATLHLFYLPFYSDFTSIFARLLALCDYIDIMPENDEPSDIKISCELHTHDFYVGGKKVLL